MKDSPVKAYKSKEKSLSLFDHQDDNDWIFNNALSLNAIANFEGYLVKVNQAWTKFLGFDLEELKAKPFIEFVHPEDQQKTWDTYLWLLEGNAVTAFEARFMSNDGSYRWLLWSASAEPDKKVVYATAVDITERKAVEEELLHSNGNLESVMSKLKDQNARLDEFAHIISHNLRSPVANIQALLSFINENSSLDEYKVIYNKLNNVSIKLNETMNELLDILKIKTVSSESVQVRFKDILDKVIQLLEGTLMQSGASVTYDFKQAPILSYPKTYLESIFQNLLSNALKYKSESRKPEIHFESFKDGNKTVLKVTDNGLGIDMDRFGDKLFGMHKTFHDHEEARGVGLFLTKTQIETMGGKIYAQSEVNKGTTFFIEFIG